MVNYRPARLSAFALAAALVLVAPACGGGAGSSRGGVASVSGDESAKSSDANTKGTAEAPSDPDEAFKLYEKCMKDQGVDIESLAEDSPEGLDVEGDADTKEGDPQGDGGGEADFDFETFDAAEETCEKHLKNVDNEFDMTPEQEAAFKEADAKFRECMKDEGVEVPEMDLDGDSGAIDTDELEDGEDPQGDDPSFKDDDFDFEKFDEASKKCQKHLDEIEDQFEEES